MEQPEGFVDPEHPEWVCEIIRSLYGLKQSPRQWNAKLHEFLLSVGLTQSSYDPSIYYVKEDVYLKGLIVVHVDDLAITGEDTFIENFIKKLKATFEVSRCGACNGTPLLIMRQVRIQGRFHLKRT